MLETPKVAVLRGMAICAATHVCGEELLYKCGSPWTVVSEGDRMFLPSRIAQYERTSSYERSSSVIDRKSANISLIFSSVSVSPFAALSVEQLAWKI